MQDPRVKNLPKEFLLAEKVHLPKKINNNNKRITKIMIIMIIMIILIIVILTVAIVTIMVMTITK